MASVGRPGRRGSRCRVRGGESTGADWTPLVLRGVVGPIFLAQGIRKVLGAPELPHGRAALAAMLQRGGFPFPRQLALAIGVAELVGGASMLVGLLVRPWAAALSGIMVVAIARFKWAQGFIGGWDWPYAVLGACVALLVGGPGRFSLDRRGPVRS